MIINKNANSAYSWMYHLCKGFNRQCHLMTPLPLKLRQIGYSNCEDYTMHTATKGIINVFTPVISHRDDIQSHNIRMKLSSWCTNLYC